MNGIRRDCTHPRARHVHGTYRAYEADRCRCLPCCVAWAQARRRSAAGMGYHEPGAGFVPRVGTDRRIRALLALGWRHSDITARLAAIAGKSHATDSAQIAKPRGPWVWDTTAAAVAVVYDELSMRVGPSARTRDRARKKGYPPPLAWDDDTLDDPNAEPIGVVGDGLDELDEVAVERLMAGHLRLPTYDKSPERLEAIRRLAAAGFTDPDIGDRVGMTRDAVHAARKRHHIPAGVPKTRDEVAA